MTALAVLCGATVGTGLWLFVLGLRGRPFMGHRPSRRVSPADGRLVLRLGLGIAAFLAVLLVTGWPVGAVLGGALAVALPSLVGGRGAREEELAKIEAIASWAEMLRDTVSAGSGLAEAIRVSAPVAPGPLRGPVSGLAVRMDRGGIVGGLAWFGDEMADPMADLIVAALTLAATEQSKRLADLLGSLATATREQAAMRLRVEAGRARTRTVAGAVAGIAAVSVVAFLAFDRPYLHPYDSATGQLMLGLVGACFGGAFWLLARMGRIPAPVRLVLHQAEEPA